MHPPILPLILRSWPFLFHLCWHFFYQKDRGRLSLPYLRLVDCKLSDQIPPGFILTYQSSVCVTSICRLVSLKRIADSSDPTCKPTYLSITPRISSSRLKFYQTTTSVPHRGLLSNATLALFVPAYPPSVLSSHASYLAYSRPSARPMTRLLCPAGRHTGIAQGEGQRLASTMISRPKSFRH